MPQVATYLNDSGFLAVDNHKIYWEDWGNKSAKPIFHLHGGPGGGFNDKHKLLYNPSKHRVIFHDQRGCGKSTPGGLTETNTAQDLIADIERLRKKFGVEKIVVAGGSWGCTLSLLYAMAHPQQVERLILWSVFLGRQAEVDYTNEGFPRYNFPEAWERFIALVPTQNRLNGNSIMQFYAEKVFLPDAAVAQRYAREWSLWEMSLISLNYDQRRIESEVAADEETLKRAKIQLHYALWKCFIPEDYILKNISKITHIPCAVVHGRFDMCCPPFIAADLAKAYGSNLSLQWVNSGHLRTEPEMLAALRATINARF